MPTAVVLSVSWYMNRAMANTQEASEEFPNARVENLTINIFKGNEGVKYTVKSSLTPMQIAQEIDEKEVKNKKVTIFANGRKLNNEMSVGLQGVRNGDFFQIKTGEMVSQEGRGVRRMMKIVAFSVVILVMWRIYFMFYDEFSFFTRMMLVFATEMLCLMIYKSFNKS